MISNSVEVSVCSLKQFTVSLLLVAKRLLEMPVGIIRNLAWCEKGAVYVWAEGSLLHTMQHGMRL